MRRERHGEVKPRDCGYCGESFIPIRLNAVGRRVTRPKYCSERCKGNAMTARKKARLHARLGDSITRQCVHCGEDFEVDPKLPGGLVNSKRYCSIPCQRQGNRDRRRARIKSLPNKPIDRYRIYERDNWTCGLCGGHVDKAIKWPHPMAPSIDHIVPVVAGGSHTPDNVQCAHLGCNLDANAKGHPKTPLPKIGKVAS